MRCGHSAVYEKLIDTPTNLVRCNAGGPLKNDTYCSVCDTQKVLGEKKG